MSDFDIAPPGLVDSLKKHAKLNYALDATLFDLKQGPEDGLWAGYFRSSLEGRFKLMAQAINDEWDIRRVISRTLGANVSSRMMSDIRAHVSSTLGKRS